MSYRLLRTPGILAALSLAALWITGCLPLSRGAESRPEGMARALLANPSMDAVRDIDPTAYESLRRDLTETLRADDDLGGVAPKIQTFITTFVMKHLPHKSAETQKRFMSHRLTTLKQMYSISPKYAYANIRGESLQGSEEEIKTFVEAMDGKSGSAEVAAVLKAPDAPPIPSNDAQTEKDLTSVFAALGEKNLRLLASQTPDVDAYCQAYFQYLEEILALPDTRAVQLFRHLEDLPRDNRGKTP